ncbi:type IIL restriction-modification enzyme MmeI [Thauera mechernichensis]|uniref:Type IIL restriction-modification enzyme MmeI n=1 Tax=Thauera mechernichensis TaxID=82788 RepID=A0ABW3WIW0_9RHOO
MKSPTKSVQAFADKPTLFTQDRQRDKDYLGVPEVSSERRRFIPTAFLCADIIARDFQLDKNPPRAGFFSLSWIAQSTRHICSTLTSTARIYLPHKTPHFWCFVPELRL